MALQDLIDTLRFMEYSPTPGWNVFSYPYIVDASGKEPLGGQVYVGITLKLKNAKVKFADRPPPTFVQCRISGGNLTAVDENGDELDPVEVSDYVQVVRTASSSATLVEQEALQYASYGGGVSVDAVNGQPGTEYPVGNKEFPVNNVQDAVKIANSKGLSELFIIGPITLDTGDDVRGLGLRGVTMHASTIIINPGAQTEGVRIAEATVSGTLDGVVDLTNCQMGNLSNITGHFHECMLVGPIALSGSEPAQFIKCVDALPGAGVPTIDLGGSGRALGVWGYHGGLKLINKTGTDKVSVNMDSGRLILDSTITNGQILVKGVGLCRPGIEDNHSGTASVDTDGLVNPITVADQVWDAEALAHTLEGSMGKFMQEILGLSGQRNFKLFDMEWSAAKKMLSGTARAYPTPEDVDADTNHIVELSVTAAYDDLNRMVETKSKVV